MCIGSVRADAEFDGERNHTHIRGELGAQSVIPAKSGKKKPGDPRSTSRNAPVVSVTALLTPRSGRERLLFIGA